MSRWLQQGLSSLSQLREQASEFAQEVLSETKVETDDPVANLQVAKARIAELESALSSNANEIIVLRQNNAQLHERAQTVELQLHQLEKQKLEGLGREEGWTINLDSPPIPGVPISRAHDFEESGDSMPLSPTSFQFEVRKLNDEIKQLQAECLHWKQLVKQQQVGVEDPAEQIGRLYKENEVLKHKLSASYEEHQSELIYLQEEHRNQLAQLSAKLSSANGAESLKSEKGWDDWETWTERSAESSAADNIPSKGWVVDPEEIKQLRQENINLAAKLKELEDHQPEPHSSNDALVESLRSEIETLEMSLSDLDQQHQIELNQLLQSKTSLAATCQDLRQEVVTLQSSVCQRDSQVQQLENETKELSDAYNDLNDQFEKQKQESGNVVSNNRELVNRLDALKGDLVEYEEKYERCKVENEKAVRQLEMLTTEFDKLKQDLAQNRSVDDPRRWQEQILKLSHELEDSLKKREELITNVGKFQEVVESFEEKVNRFRDDNVRLRQENAELNETLSGLGDVKQTFAETDEELSEIRRSLKEYQLTYLKKELFWRQQVEDLSDENETLKKEIVQLNAAKAEHQQLNGQLVKLSETNGSNGDSSYIHIEMVADGSQAETGSDHTAELKTSGSTTEHSSESQSLTSLLEKYRHHVGPDVVKQIESSEMFQVKKPDSWEDNWQSDSWEPDEPEHTLKVSSEQQTDSWALEEAESMVKVPAEQQTMESDSEAQVKEILESLNEKTEECESMQKELNQNRNELQEREQLVQQVFAELKGLELQLNESRNQAEIMNNLLNERNIELDHMKQEHVQLQDHTVALKEQLDVAAHNSASSVQQNSEVIEQLKRELNAAAEYGQQSSALLTAERQSSQKLQELLNNKINELNDLKIELAQWQEYNSTLKNQLDLAVNRSSNITEQNTDVMEQLKHELNMVIQTKDQTSASLTTERQNSQKLQELLNEKIHELDCLKHEHVQLQERTAALEKQLEAAVSNSTSSLQQTSDALEHVKRELNMVIQAKDQTSTVLTAERQRSQKLQEMLNEKTIELEHLKSEQARSHEQTVTLQQQLEVAVNNSTNSTQQTSEALEQSKRELHMVIQAKDRASAELFAERQHSQKLQQQVNLLEDSLQKTSKETERLRQHLLQIEEAYTNEAVKSEERETALRTRLKELEAQLLVQLETNKDGSQQLGDQLKDMQTQLEVMADQRDMALLQMADVQIELEKSQRSLANLQNVLQHFQQERDSKVFGEVENYKHEIEAMKREKLNNEKIVLDLQKQLKDNQEVLKAASTISEQMALRDQAFKEIKQLLASAEDKGAKLQSQIVELQKVRDGKIEKDVLKNLLLGYFCAPSNKKPEVAHLLGSILGFSADEFKKSEGSTGGGGGWLQFVRLGSGGPQTADASRSAEQSLATQFIKFLETESTPKPAPVPMPVLDSSSGSISVSRSSTPAIPGSFRLELPSFSGSEQPFEDTRRSQSSSDFLRDVLKTSSSENL